MRHFRGGELFGQRLHPLDQFNHPVVPRFVISIGKIDTTDWQSIDDAVLTSKYRRVCRSAGGSRLGLFREDTINDFLADSKNLVVALCACKRTEGPLRVVECLERVEQSAIEERFLNRNPQQGYFSLLRSLQNDRELFLFMNSEFKNLRLTKRTALLALDNASFISFSLS